VAFPPAAVGFQVSQFRRGLHRPSVGVKGSRVERAHKEPCRSRGARRRVTTPLQRGTVVTRRLEAYLRPWSTNEAASIREHCASTEARRTNRHQMSRVRRRSAAAAEHLEKWYGSRHPSGLQPTRLPVAGAGPLIREGTPGCVAPSSDVGGPLLGTGRWSHVLPADAR
jgi:hypothetical protein